MNNKRVHILGICGTFMGGLALLAREYGFQVTGCDENIYPPMSDHLSDQGINIIPGYNAGDLPEADVYLIGNAMSRGNEAVEYLLNKKKNLVSGPEWLYQNILRKKKVIAVSGTHGKTSTTAMISWVFEFLGRDVGYLIAGKPKNFELSSRLGTEDIFIIEADEYDTAFFDKRAKFVHYHPDVLVINNLEFDHADIYSDLSEIKKQFHHLIRALPQNASIIYPKEDENIADLLLLGCWSKQVPFSLDKNTENHYIPSSSDCSNVEFITGGVSNSLKWSMLGLHNAQNAFSAILACREFDVPLEDILGALKNFKGVSRRQELLFEEKEVRLIDDFAHHPTAIQSTLRGLRDKYKDSRIIVLVEIRSNTIKSGFHDDALISAVRDADLVYWKSNDNNQLDKLITNSPIDAKAIASVESTANEIIKNLKPRDLLITMSNGNFDGIAILLLQKLEKRYSI